MPPNPDLALMRRALRLANRGYGSTSPNPMVGAILVQRGHVIGRGYHHRAGQPHAEIEALRDARNQRHGVRGATLYVTLEPCSTTGRTPPCADAIIKAGIKRVVVGATDPNPKHAGSGLTILRDAGIEVVPGVLEGECSALNEAFNHWIVHRTPFVTVKAAMTLDGKIATADGHSKWITGEAARAYGMELRRGADAILVGINTLLADDPALTVRPCGKALRRLILDPGARTPLDARLVTDGFSDLTTIIVSKKASPARVRKLAGRASVMAVTEGKNGLDLRCILDFLGGENVTALLVEGGGETNASFLLQALAHRVAFFYAPMILGGRKSRAGVAGLGVTRIEDAPVLEALSWRKLGGDLLLLARVKARDTARSRC